MPGLCLPGELKDAIRAFTQTQERMIASLDALGRRIEQFAENAARIDNAAADLINRRKDEFYKEHSRLKPECEKGGWEKIRDFADSVGEWCAKNWQTALKIIAVAVLVAASVVLICTGVGGIFAAMAWGAVLGAGIGGLSGGILSAIHGGSFFDGFVNVAFARGDRQPHLLRSMREQGGCFMETAEVFRKTSTGRCSRACQKAERIHGLWPTALTSTLRTTRLTQVPVFRI
jgi:hypothetical protein